MDPAIDNRIKDLLYNFASLFLGIEFVFWGISNFTADYDFDTRFGLPSWIQIPIGIAETTAGFGLLHPRTNVAALLILTIVMSGAVYHHFSAQDGGYATPLKYLIYFAIMLYYKTRRRA